MGVSDGSPVNAANTNAAFLDADSDDTALGKISLNNIADPTNSGPTISNIQREFNSVSTWLGKPTNISRTITPTWTNNDIGLSTDSVTMRADNLTAAFNSVTGHMHDGSTGSGGPLTGASIAGVPFIGFFVQGINLTGVTGTTWDVSTELTGKVPSASLLILGVVVNAPYNKVILRDVNGDEFVDGFGNVVYGRVTESVGVWTLSFYVLIATVETVYSFGIATAIDWYYQELYDLLFATPVYSPLASTPSDNTTADVIDATTANKGKVLLSSTSVTSVGSASSEGTANATVANANHVHQGIHAVQEFTEAVDVYGDIVLKAGLGVTIARTGNTFLFTATGGGSPTVEYRTLTGGEAAAEMLTLTGTPATASSTLLDPTSGTAQIYSVDYTVSGSTLSWVGLGLSGILATGDVLRIVYWQ